MPKKQTCKKNNDVIRVGVVGVGRGQGFARGAGEHLGMKLVALCDTWEERLTPVGKELNVTTYTDFDRFLEHDMDAVILANYFHQHAPLAIKALHAGFHVMSETAACFTLGEGMALIDAVEKTQRTYMFAENYPYMLCNQEMRRLYQSGSMGHFQYGEGEYIHPFPAEEYNKISCGRDHWRNWLPNIYYCTHALAPVMFVTDTWPTKLNGFVIAHDPHDTEISDKTMRRADPSWAVMLRMDTGALARIVGLSLRGHGNWYRFHCTRGLMENPRGGDTGSVRVRHEPYDCRKGEPSEMLYHPQFPEFHKEAMAAGHGGGDFFMNLHFARAIRTGQPPYLDVYRGVTMSIVGPLAYRSALNDSNTIVIPDVRKKSERAKYRNDHWNPDPAQYKKGYPKPSILGDITPSKKAEACARKVWKQCGYTGD